MVNTMLFKFLLACIILSINSFVTSSNKMYALDSNQKNYSGAAALSPGQSITIKCQHYEPMKWSRTFYGKGNENLISKDRINIEGDKLKISNIDFTDAGLYYCEKDTNTYRFYIYVFTITETVNATVPIMKSLNELSGLNQLKLNDRGSANVSCFCDAGTNNSKVSITWKGGEYNSVSSMYMIDSTPSKTGLNSTLILKKTNNRQDLYGEYTCSCNTAPEATKERKVYMEVPPIFDEQEWSVRVTEGDDLALECHVWAYPNVANASVYWSFQNNVDLRSGITVTIVGDRKLSSRLNITKVTYGDRGVYTCHASNAVGNNSATYMLRVKGRYAALWPFIGILIQLVILVAIIVIYEWKKSQKSKGDSLKLNVDSNNEADAACTERSNEPESVRQRLVKA